MSQYLTKPLLRDPNALVVLLDSTSFDTVLNGQNVDSRRPVLHFLR